MRTMGIWRAQGYNQRKKEKIMLLKKVLLATALCATAAGVSADE